MRSEIIDLRGSDKKGVISIKLPPSPAGGKFGCPDNFEKLNQFIVETECGVLFDIECKFTFLFERSSATLQVSGICKSTTIHSGYNSSTFEIVEQVYSPSEVEPLRDKNGDFKASVHLPEKVKGMVKAIRKKAMAKSIVAGVMEVPRNVTVSRDFIDDVARLVNYIETKDVKYANSVSIFELSRAKDDFRKDKRDLLEKIGRMTLEIENLTTKG